MSVTKAAAKTTKAKTTKPKAKTKGTSAAKNGTGSWPGEVWDECHQIRKSLCEIGIEAVAMDELREWPLVDRDEVREWIETIAAGKSARLPDRLLGKLPVGWKRPGIGPKGEADILDITALNPARTESQQNSQAAGSPLYQEIAIADIDPSPYNPRTHFDEAALKSLGESLKKEGQLQNLVVFGKGGGRYEIIAGERRWRAAKIAGLKMLACKVLDVTEEEAIQLRGIENEDRQNFSAFELARWYQQLGDRCGMSQRAIAKYVGVSQGQVGNTLALLKLPEEWEAKVNTQEISPTCLRHLSPWNHRPQVLEAVAMAVKEAGPFDGAEITVEEFRDIIDEAVREQSRSLDSWYCRFKITDELREQLDIEAVTGPYGHKEDRAFNTALWEKLQKEAKKAEKQKQQKAQAKQAERNTASAKPEEERGPSQHELAARWGEWWRGALGEKLRGKLNKAQKLKARQLVTCLLIHSGEFADGLCDSWLGRMVISYSLRACQLATIDAETFEREIIEHLPAALEDDSCYWDGDETELLTAFGKAFGIDPERDWEPEFEWLDLLSIEQLRRLPAAQLVAPEYLQSLDKKDLIERLLEHWDKGQGIPKVFRLATDD